ncbi:MAG TPA: hypothetical protein VMF32_04170 [Xanthobacteraceae bacterium]|nr:hypothetical protein [Xanthobacteraceae bacterium]
MTAKIIDDVNLLCKDTRPSSVYASCGRACGRGRPSNLILPQVVQTVIDVGINRLPTGRLVGDIDFEGTREKASLVTPVPRGVGPMTVTVLLVNTIASATRSAPSS